MMEKRGEKGTKGKGKHAPGILGYPQCRQMSLPKSGF